jgi:hypothetical protein
MITLWKLSKNMSIILAIRLASQIEDSLMQSIKAGKNVQVIILLGWIQMIAT